ncbi:alpha/beta hydrolase [Nocardia sp. NEAU-G5]|uniref:Alpha/beta hydrolase n=1 Tax=Nocardia albiluteola TaxID=2842303 RepID=A0ABS6B5P1_9NOCA|nr:alpha/beta hydrolase [Nocardia albiluteola]MBU3062520.1 alpha/beta hydrolase [Nocardia albiluteola]MBU3065646.1 alpha/beta hydrolase [Nocardia albiluteola]
MSNFEQAFLDSIPLSLKRAALQTVLSLPRPIRRAIARPAAHVDGQEQDLDAQLLVRLMRLAGMKLFSDPIDRARIDTVEGSSLVGGRPAGPGMAIRDITIPAGDHDIPATLYCPSGVSVGSGLLVFYHGGGWSVGSRRSHEPIARFLAAHADVRVLSIEYRLAPENPFPAAVDDAVTAFGYAHAHAAELGADPDRIAVGGDSAGGNLAAVVAQHTAHAGGPAPAFQLLIYPATDFEADNASRSLFATGFLLTAEDLQWGRRTYIPAGADPANPRLSPLRGDVTGVAPAHIATAGFDPLRDEGEGYADKLAAAGVTVTRRRHSSLPHGYLNFLCLGAVQQAALDTARALAAGLAPRPRD